jgi:uncharacterized protein (TIGR02452 family)
VQNKDCLYAAEELHDEGLNPCVLDMASDAHFGGSYKQGARAQEEEVIRRSGLAFAVDHTCGVQKIDYYPLSNKSRAAGLYVPNVPIFRAGYDKGYQYLNRPFEVAVGIIAAKYAPKLDYSSGLPRLNARDADATYQKIRNFFHMAYQNGHRSVVFGALGCGAFKNPPNHVAEIAMDVIDKEFKHCFQKIVFAVIDDHNTGTEINPTGNFLPFARHVKAYGGKAFDTNGQET